MMIMTSLIQLLINTPKETAQFVSYRLRFNLTIAAKIILADEQAYRHVPMEMRDNRKFIRLFKSEWSCGYNTSKRLLDAGAAYIARPDDVLECLPLPEDIQQEILGWLE